jgi:diguanylate cyclase (GGDEF)-like protein
MPPRRAGEGLATIQTEQGVLDFAALVVEATRRGGVKPAPLIPRQRSPGDDALSSNHVENPAESTGELAPQVPEAAEANEYIDPMTGLGSRVAFKRDLYALLSEVALPGHAEVTLGILDLNNMKGINDTHGHKTGDDYIVAASKGLEEACSTLQNGSKHDSVASTPLVLTYHLSGDEFAVIVVSQKTEEAEDAAKNQQLATIFETIGTHIEAGAISAPDGSNIRIETSIGYASYEESDLPDGLFHAADVAMQSAKSNRKIIESHSLPAAERARLAIAEASLRAAEISYRSAASLFDARDRADMSPELEDPPINRADVEAVLADISRLVMSTCTIRENSDHATSQPKTSVEDALQAILYGLQQDGMVGAATSAYIIDALRKMLA